MFNKITKLWFDLVVWVFDYNKKLKSIVFIKNQPSITSRGGKLPCFQEKLSVFS